MRFNEDAVTPISERWLRPIGFALILVGLAIIVGSLLICIEMLFPIYLRLWRQAPIVETVYPAFFMIAGLLLGPVTLLGGFHGLLFGKPLTSRSPVWFKIALWLFKVGAVLMIVVGPALAIGTTAALAAMDYQTCSQLRRSGSGWQVFWVKNDGFCFRPDSYIEDNWPCKDMDGKTYCLRADGL
ncbi:MULTISPECIES: hypothetical protein [Pseudomonas]|uniref:hypothetical protein n=1 Tax=Pseudomonas TaxID=286 RepID=UPI002114DE89|nr:hypothetical protein [Pseudomonas sp. RW407]